MKALVEPVVLASNIQRVCSQIDKYVIDIAGIRRLMGKAAILTQTDIELLFSPSSGLTPKNNPFRLSKDQTFLSK